MRKIIYTLFPSLMPKVWRTKNKDFIVYRWDDEAELFVGSNNVQLSLGYVLKKLIVYELDRKK